MSPAPALRRAVRPLEIRSSDQRLHQRYPVILELDYKVLEGRRVTRSGHGRTLNISSGGLLFETASEFEAKPSAIRAETIELTIEWPISLGETCALKLLMRGRIVRKDSGRLAVRTERHEFRTAGLAVRKELKVHPNGG